MFKLPSEWEMFGEFMGSDGLLKIVIIVCEINVLDTYLWRGVQKGGGEHSKGCTHRISGWNLTRHVQRGL